MPMRALHKNSSTSIYGGPYAKWALNGVYEYPDATETATVTEIDTSYGFTFEPGSVLISTDAFDAQSTITLTAYAQDYVLSGTTVTPSVSYTTEYVTLTTTIEPLNGLQPSTMLTTVTTTSTDTVTVTESTNAPESEPVFNI
ncbi:hypothetical protein EV178_005968 [Coemansia sp. RSA 1646]|nr:hypothetical protein EV178_005968 [Coemansia sp. RSA 1646]